MADIRHDYDAPAPKKGATSWLVLAIFLALCLGTGFLGSLLTTPHLEPWYASLEKPWFNPPNWVFGPVWTTLYILMAISAWLVWRAPVDDSRKNGPLALFLVHLVVNVGWSGAFFAMENPALGLAVVALLFVLVAVIAVRFARIVPLAGLLFVPYVIWVGYASVLNGAIWWLNRPI